MPQRVWAVLVAEAGGFYVVADQYVLHQVVVCGFDFQMNYGALTVLVGIYLCLNSQFSKVKN